MTPRPPARPPIRLRPLALLLPLLAALPARAQTPDRVVAVTIDDLPVAGPDPSAEAWTAVTDGLLAALRAEGVPAVGFVNEGKLVRDGAVDPARVALLRRWLAEGHELGNHTHGHLSLHRVPLDTFLADVARGERVTRPLAGAAGRPFRYFRHPFLMTGRDTLTHRAVEAALAARQLEVAPVTFDNADWIFARAYDRARADGDPALAARVAAAYAPYLDAKVAYWEAQTAAVFGRPIPHVLLLHANRLNADHFGAVAAMLRARGYRFAPLADVLADPAYRTREHYTGPAGISWVHRWAMAKGLPRSSFRGEPAVPDWVMAAAGVDAE